MSSEQSESNSEQSKTSDSPLGKIQWCDLTTQDADSLQQFYQKVAGWEAVATPVDDYHDWTMMAGVEGAKKSAVAGICHRKGQNDHLPNMWMVYINVLDIEESLQKVQQNGGKILNHVSGSPIAVIEDPSGAVCSLYQVPQT